VIGPAKIRQGCSNISLSGMVGTFFLGKGGGGILTVTKGNNIRSWMKGKDNVSMGERGKKVLCAARGGAS